MSFDCSPQSVAVKAIVSAKRHAHDQMPRVARAERRRKETAFEALEEVLKEHGRQRRPSVGDERFKAVQQAVVWWKDVRAWTDLTASQQREALATHSSWRAYRRKREAPSPDCDPVEFVKYKALLGPLLAAGASCQGVAGTPGARRKAPSSSATPPLSFTGSAAAFSAWTAQRFPSVRRKRQRSVPVVTKSDQQPGCGRLAVRHITAGARPEQAHLDFIGSNGELICSKRPREDAKLRTGTSRVCSTCESAASLSSGLQPPSRMVTKMRHNDHYDYLVPTNPENTEFAVVCKEVAKNFQSAPTTENTANRTAACECGASWQDAGLLDDPASLLEWCDSVRLVPDDELQAISGLMSAGDLGSGESEASHGSTQGQCQTPGPF